MSSKNPFGHRNERKNFVNWTSSKQQRKRKDPPQSFWNFSTRDKQQHEEQQKDKQDQKGVKKRQRKKTKSSLNRNKKLKARRFLNFLILAHVFKTQHTYLQTMFAATQQIASVAGLKATKVQVRVSIVSDLCRSSSLLLLLLDSWNG